MGVELTNSKPIDEGDPKVQEWMATLQGNILKGHGRDHGIYIFFSFGPDIAGVKATLGMLARLFVTSALTQHRQTERYRRLRIPGALFGSLLLSSHGYRGLGCDPDALFPDPPEPEVETSSTFALGMRSTAVADFADPPVNEWEPGYQQRIDAMLMLADDDEQFLTRNAREALDSIEKTCAVVVVETGQALRNADGAGIEHFGFADGRSQPLYLRSDFQSFNAQDERRTDNHGESISQWDPFEPLHRVLVRDPAVGDPLCHGSFLVFRKLEQNVRGFRARLPELAQQLGFSREDEARAGGLVVGRFEDGTPLTLQKEDGWCPVAANNFAYATDIRGARCPLQSHVRKVNPRGHTLDNSPADTERRRRITRRSITYDTRGHGPLEPQERELPPSKDVGILFMCFQASVRRQFAFMQKHWCNKASFPQGLVGVDALVGQGGDRSFGWPTVYNKDTSTAAPFESFIQMRGGEYFFAPSLPFFEQMARGDREDVSCE